MLGLLGETWNEVLDAALAAFKNKEHGKAETLFRRLSKLANTQEWSDLALLKLNPTWLEELAAETIFEFLIERATPTARESLAWRLNDAALHRQEKDPATAKILYERSLKATPNEASILGNFAVFLEEELKDADAAEIMYEHALKANPKGANILGNYAVFLQDARKDMDAADAMFKRALEANPKHENHIENHGRFCLTVGRVSEGMDLVDRALAIRADSRSPGVIDAECWMYVFCCGEPDRRSGALRHLRTLVEIHSINTGNWDFSGVIQRARTMDHPDAAWLPNLADVLAGRCLPSALDDWPAWRAAAPQ